MSSAFACRSRGRLAACALYLLALAVLGACQAQPYRPPNGAWKGASTDPAPGGDLAGLRARLDALDTWREPRAAAALEVELGQRYSARGNWREARRYFRMARYDCGEENDLHAAATLGLAEVQLRDRLPQAAVLVLSPLVSDLPGGADSQRARLLYALALDASGRGADARRWYTDGAPAAGGPLDALWREIARLYGLDKNRAQSAGKGAGATLARARWNPAPIRSSRLEPMGPIRRITIHHSGFTASDTSLRDAARQIRSIQRTHLQRGYGDIGYHYLIDSLGRIWEGRSERFQGAHAGNGRANKNNLGICLLGDFRHRAPPPAQVNALERLVREERKRHGIARSQIFGHGEIRLRFTGHSTECPGARLQAIVQRLRRGG